MVPLGFVQKFPPLSLYPVMFLWVCVLADEDRAVDEEHRDAIAHRLREDVVRKT